MVQPFRWIEVCQRTRMLEDAVRPLNFMCRLLMLWILFPCVLAAAESPADVLANLRAGHPRLLFTDAQLDAALAEAKIDPLRARLHERIIALAEEELGTQPVRRVLIGPRLLDKSRTALGRVLTCAMAFRLTKDMRFLSRAKAELFATADFADWNPSHFLDVAEMSLAFAIGYDWLHGHLSPHERARLKAAMMRHSLSFAPAAYASAKPTDKRVGFVTRTNNWNQVCNGGLLAAALALADEEPALARLVVGGALRSLPLAMEAAYSPDGAYPEGPGYWSYGTGYNVVAIAALESALGSDFGLSRQPGFDRTAIYRIHVESPLGGAFNYADGRASIGAQPQFTWLALRFNLSGPLSHCRETLGRELSQRSAGDRLMAMHAVWFPPAASEISAPFPLDIRFRGPAELAIFRSAWDDPRALFLGFKAGRNDVNHAHLDLGSFVLDADGVRWAHDLGPDNYNLPDYFGKARWSYYRLSNHSHNTLTPGGRLQEPTASAPIIAFGSQPARAFAVADLTRAYPGMAAQILRGVAMIDRSRVLVQDELTGAKPGTPLTSRILTSARVKLDDARHATLTQKGRTLRVEILAPEGASFRASAARPPTSAENQNDGFTALTAEAKAESPHVRVALLLTPVGDRWHDPAVPPAITPLENWK